MADTPTDSSNPAAKPRRAAALKPASSRAGARASALNPFDPAANFLSSPFGSGTKR